MDGDIEHSDIRRYGRGYDIADIRRIWIIQQILRNIWGPKIGLTDKIIAQSLMHNPVCPSTQHCAILLLISFARSNYYYLLVLVYITTLFILV